MASNSALKVAALCLALLAHAGCSHKRLASYKYGGAAQYHISDNLREVTGEQVERGEPLDLLDGLGWVIGIPGKIVLWDSRVDNHDVSPETEAAVAQYLAANDLSTVKVRLNQYAPGDEWRRLRHNDAVGPGWRYTLGTVYWLGDTIFPGRVWGGDRYNPFTNTINIYSDAPAIALHEAGHAKDWARRKYKGLYSGFYILPGAPLWHEAVASRDALAYVAENGTPEEQEEAYRLLYPAYGTYVGNALGDFRMGAAGLPYISSVLVGHLVGRVQGRKAANEKRAVEVSLSDDLQLSGPAAPPLELSPLEEPEHLPLVTPDPALPDFER